jgi:pSer/pThr/pTyr-binding forkhead associated (FHA) protein
VAAVPEPGPRLVVRVKKAFFEPGWTTQVLEPGNYVLGRSPEAHLILPDRLVSRRHARVSFYEGRWYIQDLGSRNGTYVNGQNIRGRGPVPIPDEGVEVLVGTTLLELKPLAGDSKSGGGKEKEAPKAREGGSDGGSGEAS